MAVDYATREGVAVIVMNHPPINALAHAVRQGIVQGVERALSDDAVVAIVIAGFGTGFCGGADINEFGTPMIELEPTLHTMIATIEASTKPVIAAIHGMAFGGGLELALGAHYRIAAPGAQIALPEVKLGLLPGAGGSQRLPRAIGLELALDMIVSGNGVRSETLQHSGLFDAMVDGELLDAAVAFARDVASKPAPHPRVRDRQIAPDGAEDLIRSARNTVAGSSKHFPAPEKCIDVIAYGFAHGFDAGLKYESENFFKLLNAPESRALRHAFLGERAAAKIADVPSDTPVRAIRRVGVVGAGTMGGGIAMNFLNAGLPVTLLETKAEALNRGVDTIRKNYEAAATKGKLTTDDVKARMGLLTPTLSYDDLEDADLIVEAVFEDIEVKEAGALPA